MYSPRRAVSLRTKQHVSKLHFSHLHSCQKLRGLPLLGGQVPSKLPSICLSFGPLFLVWENDSRLLLFLLFVLASSA